jgi:hypothetical protein
MSVTLFFFLLALMYGVYMTIDLIIKEVEQTRRYKADKELRALELIKNIEEYRKHNDNKIDHKGRM